MSTVSPTPTTLGDGSVISSEFNANGDLNIASTGMIAVPVNVHSTAFQLEPAFGVTVMSSTVTKTATIETPRESGMMKTVCITGERTTLVATVVDFVLPILGATTLGTDHIATFYESGSITCVSVSTVAWALVSLYGSDSTDNAGAVFSS